MRTLATILISLCFVSTTNAFDHQQDVVYGYKDGLALVMDVLEPTKRNGAGIIWVVSGGMNSGIDQVRNGIPDRIRALVDNGYVVFAAMHGSQPKYTVTEIQRDMPRAVRFIRHNAKRFRIDGNRIGAIGFSSGGQLTLHLATSALGKQRRAWDPVDNLPSRIQAAVAYFPGTDLVNFGTPNKLITEHFAELGHKAGAAFEFQAWNDPLKKFERINDAQTRQKLFGLCSPITHLSKDDPPMLLIHGDKDELVPLQQSQSFVERAKEVGATAELRVMEGKGHGWRPPTDDETNRFVAWFDQHLLGDASE